MQGAAKTPVDRLTDKTHLAQKTSLKPSIQSNTGITHSQVQHPLSTFPSAASSLLFPHPGCISWSNNNHPGQVPGMLFQKKARTAS